uniref:ASH domain-containing protein n=1 Tax=Macrostomum lignano TaxID=282301 RepID=A0A1I8I804_9PLAT
CFSSKFFNGAVAVVPFQTNVKIAVKGRAAQQSIRVVFVCPRAQCSKDLFCNKGFCYASVAPDSIRNPHLLPPATFKSLKDFQELESDGFCRAAGQKCQLSLTTTNEAGKSVLILVRTALLICLSSSVSSDCHQSTRTVDLNYGTIAQIWQAPSNRIDCLGLISNNNTSDEFPASRQLKFGPSWLVLQLKQPMKIASIDIIQGTGVKAFGSLSLPLAIKFEDPCRTRLSVINNGTDWRPLIGHVASANQKPVAYMMLNSSTNALRWQAINITGAQPRLQLLSNETYIYCSSLAQSLSLTLGDKICFNVAEKRCDNGAASEIDCDIAALDGKVSRVN